MFLRDDAVDVDHLGQATKCDRRAGLKWRYDDDYNHLRCFREENIEGILNDYSTDAFFSHTKDSCEEEPKSENCSKALLDEFGKPGASEKALTAIFEGDYAYLVWSGETADNFYELACDTFVMRNGKITAQSFAAKITSKQSQ